MMLARKSLLALARTSSCEQVVAYFASRRVERSNLLRVLTYHRVNDLEATPHLYPGLLSATPRQFTQQMEHLQRYYRVVSLQQVIDAVQGRQELPPKAVLITFDDAYQDFLLHAWPTLQRFELPAVLFVPTAFPDAPERCFWWDRLHNAFRDESQRAEMKAFGSLRQLLDHVKSLPHEQVRDYVEQLCHDDAHDVCRNAVMSWAELRELAEAGLALAPHTSTHPLMNRVSLDAAVEQAVASREDLLREIGSCPAVFAYPGGAYSERLPQRLRESGFELAFTTCRGINDLQQADPMQMRRINVQHSTPHSIVCGQLLGLSRHLNRMWPLQSAVS